MEVELAQMAQDVQNYLDEHFTPGERLTMLVGLEQEPSDEELEKLSQALQEGGLHHVVEMGATPTWPQTLRLVFPKPSRQAHTLVVPFGVLLVGALAAAGLVAVLGIAVMKAGSDLGEAIKKGIVPLAVIGVAALVFSQRVRSPA